MTSKNDMNLSSIAANPKLLSYGVSKVISPSDVMLSSRETPALEHYYGCGADAIAGLRHNPKILWRDDAEIVGDGVAEGGPVFWNLSAQKIEHLAGELGASVIGLVAGDIFVREAP